MAEPLGELLRSLRSTALLSQEALAERSGLSTRTVSDIETGSARTPRLITVMLLAEALGLSQAERERLQEAARKPTPRTPGTGSALPEAILRAPRLVGRDADMARIGELLSGADVRLVTLVGPAGVGKTSLAMGAAPPWASHFEAAVAMVELATSTEPSLVPAAIAHVLGVRESPDTTASDAVTAHLRDRRFLLILDNLEHLTPCAAWIGALLTACPKLTILATSREPLRLRSEHIYALRPLATQAAITLFVARAQMVKPEFDLSDANSEAVERIVDHLDGLPLAIELAAPRLLLLAPKALAARLERRLPLLGDGATDRPERQQTMRGAIGWSYDLLSETEQRLFRRLAVLHGGGSLEAAAAAAGDESDEPSILFRLAPLVEKNMVALQEDVQGEPRVSMLEMLREYAHERLVESGELSATQRRHAQHQLRFAETAERELAGAAQGWWLARFDREHANLLAALDWTYRSDEIELGFSLLGAVWRFWWLHGYLTEGLAWLRRFISARAPGIVDERLYAKVLRGYVVLLSAYGSFDEALVSCNEAVALQRRMGDETGLAASLTSLGVIYQFQGDYDRAAAMHAETLAIRRRIADEVGMATSLSNLSSTALSKNDLTRAAEFAEESVAIYRRLGHTSGLAHAMTKLGLIAAYERNYPRAEEFFKECLRIQRAIGNTGSIFYSLVNLGATAHKRGAYETALAHFQEAFDLLESVPNKAGAAKALEDLAATTAALGDPSRAARLFGAADALRRAIRVPLFPFELAEYEAEVAAVRAMLGDEPFDVQWRIGNSITLERALEEAREIHDAR